jgi:hypothetical protein
MVNGTTTRSRRSARRVLDYRFRNLESARSNARLMGRRGLQFPWESAPSSGEEAAPMPGSAAWREDHASLDIARAFALCADVTGDDAFLRDKAWPVLAGVAEWVKSRVTKRRGKYEIHASMANAGIPQRHISRATTSRTILCKSRGLFAGINFGLSKDTAGARQSSRLVQRNRSLASGMAFD